MKVLITNTGAWGTGSGTVSEGVKRELKLKGHEVLCIYCDLGLNDKEDSKYYKSKDYHIIKFPVIYDGLEIKTFPLILNDPNPRNYANAKTFKELTKQELDAYFGYVKIQLKNVIEEFKPDVIECQHIWAMDYLVGELGHKYISVAHHSDQLGFESDERMGKYALESSKKAEYIFAISDYVKTNVNRLYGVELEKIINVQNGYDQRTFQPFKVNRIQVLKEFNLEKYVDMPVITFCGKVSKTKGVDILLEANKFIQKKKKSLLVILGGGSIDKFSDEEKKRFHFENVEFLGHRSAKELALLHNIAHVSVLPSRAEGFGIGALEAMGCGTPLVATKVGGLVDFTVGKLVEKENPLSLANELYNILNMDKEDERYKKLREKAYKKAREYSWESIVEKRMPYYEKVKNRKKISLSILA